MKDEEIITIPNIITLLRLLLIPFFVITMVYGETEIAVLLFAAIALGDMLDGLSARIMKQKTRIGSLLDTTTDWLVIITTLITLMVIKKYISIDIIIITLVAMVISLIAKGVYINKARKSAPTVIGKINVAFAYVTVITFLMDFAYKNYFLVTTVFLTYATMINYVIKDVKLFIK